MRLVILESPFGTPDPRRMAENVEYARACLRDSLNRGEAPMASHLLYPQSGLNDANPEHRARGIEAGLAWGPSAQGTVVYVDRGVSRGMLFGIDRAIREERPIEFRRLRDYEGPACNCRHTWKRDNNDVRYLDVSTTLCEVHP